MRYEYKVVPAPAKGQKAKGVKTAEGRFALSVEQLLNQLGADGWEYQRADMLPSEERAGLTGSTTNWRNLLIFRRALDEAPVAVPERAEPVVVAPVPVSEPEPAPAPEDVAETLAEAAAAPEPEAAPEGLRPVEAPEARFEEMPEPTPEFGSRRRNPPEVHAPEEAEPEERPAEGLTGIERAMRQSGSTGPD